MRYPYTLVAGKPLGVSNSSLQQIGPLLPSSNGIGQAQIQVCLNVTTGNIFIRDHFVRVIEGGRPLDLGFVYNSFSDSSQSCWQLGVGKRFLSLPSTKSPVGPTATLLESDGAIVTYTSLPQAPYLYFAPGLENGTPYLYFDYEATNPDRVWILYHPGTKDIEYYDADGYLTCRKDVGGRLVYFDYSPSGNGPKILTQIYSQSSGTNYQFVKSSLPDNGVRVSIYMVTGDTSKGLQYSDFDKDGKLQTTTVMMRPKDGNYVISYHYEPYSFAIDAFNQSDGTNVQFFYDDDKRIQRLYLGNDESSENVTFFTYDTAHLITSVQDGTHNINKFSLDTDGRIIKISRPTGYVSSSEAIENTSYQYAVKSGYETGGQISVIILPDGSAEEFEYKNAFGLLTKHKGPNGQLTEMYYTAGDIRRSKNNLSNKNPIQQKYSSESKDKKDYDISLTEVPRIKDDSAKEPDMICRIDYLKLDEKTSIPISTRYIWQKHFQHFVITSKGRVTRFLPNNENYNGSEIQFVDQLFDLSEYKPDQAPGMEEVINWVSKQNPQRISLNDYYYTSRGQKTRIEQFDKIFSDGTGDERSPGTGIETLFLDEFNNCHDHSIRHDEKVEELYTQTFDGLNRLTRLVDPLLNTTRIEYQDDKNSVQTTLPNGRIESKKTNTEGVITSEQSIVNQTARVTSYQSNTGGLPVIITNPDKTLTIKFYDGQRRLAATVTQMGFVTESLNDAVNRYKTFTQYSNPVNFNDFWSPPNLPNPARFDAALKVLKSAPDNRISYQFFDESNRPKYDVDAKNFVIEHIYDTLNREIGTVRYSQPLSTDQLSTLKQGKSIDLAFDNQKDRYTQKLYDEDNLLIFEIDAAGYVTEYKRDAGRRAIERIVYNTPISVVRNYVPVNPKITIDDKKDAHSYFYYDARNQCVGQVDAVGDPQQFYFTQFVYLACGLKQKTIDFVTPITNPDWQKNPYQIPTPIPSPEDRITTINYNLLQKPELAFSSDKKAQATEYDEMQNITDERTYNLADVMSLDPDDQRSAQARYDGWGQKYAATNTLIADVLTKIDNDPQLTDDQKKVQKEFVWNNKSLRSTYDDTGLLLFVQDALGRMTYFYYDLDRRPIITINSMGEVVEKKLNTFGETLSLRKYINRLDLSKMPLKGGFITDDIRKTLDNLKSVQDAVESYEPDLRGQIQKMVDAEGYIFTQQYSAFRECIQNNIPKDSKDPSIAIMHGFDTRGLEKETTQQTSDLKTTVTRKFENPFSKQTLLIDEINAPYQFDYDQRGDLKESKDPYNNSQKFERDALRRLTKEINSLGKVTTHEYSQTRRIEIIHSPVLGVNTFIQKNIFNEKVLQSNTLGQTETWRNSPHGKVREYCDPVGNLTTNAFDLMGQNRSTRNPNNVLNTNDYDDAGRLIAETEDAEGLKLQKTHDWHDPLGCFILTKNARGIFTAEVSDRKGRMTQRITDPNPSLLKISKNTPKLITAPLEVKPQASNGSTDVKDTPEQMLQLSKSVIKSAPKLEIKEAKSKDPQPLHLVTQKSYKGSATPTSIVQGDSSSINQSYITFQTDSYDRPVSVVIDPITNDRSNGLSLTTTQKLNAASLPVAEIDANGNITRVFYDLKKNTRFTLNPEGGITEWEYNSENKVTCKRIYDQGIDASKITDQTNLGTFANLVQPLRNDQDTLVIFLYDDDQYERFNVNSLGEVGEKRYDQAKNEIETIQYNYKIDPKQISSFTTDALSDLMSKNQDLKDRHTYRIFDDAGKERFVIDSRKAISEKSYQGKRITKTISYSALVSDPTVVAKLPADKVRDSLVLDPLNDRLTLNYYESIDRPKYTLTSIGDSNNLFFKVIQFDHDEENNLTQTCEYSDPLRGDLDYNLYPEILKQLTPDIKKDRVISNTYDHGNRRTQTLDARQNADVYVPDALGNIQQHTDRNKNIWINKHDRAQRLISEISPETKITNITAASTGKLSYSQQRVKVEKLNAFDNAGNKTSITQGNGLPDTRSIITLYNKCNNPTKTQIPNVVIDNPAQIASFSARPETVVPLVTIAITYNAKQLPVCIQNEAGQYSFKVFDSEKRLRYEISNLGKVTDRKYNSFGEIEYLTKYANNVNPNDLIQYIKTGIPMGSFESLLKPDLKLDRTLKQTYDNGGCITLMEEGPVFFYSSKFESDMKYVFTGFQTAKLKRDFNAFKEMIYQAQQNSDAKSQSFVWNENFVWFDRQGKVAAECDALNYVTRYTNNTHGEEVKKQEFATQLVDNPTSWNIPQLDAKIIISPIDRTFTTERDLLGQPVAMTRVGVVVQQLVPGQVGVRSTIFQDLASQDLTKRQIFSPTQKVISVISEDGSVSYNYYDERDFKIAETGISRTPVSIKGKNDSLIPLTYYGISAHGENVMTTRFLYGTSKADLSALPQPKQVSDDDQTQMSLRDNRGLIKTLQDPEGYLTGSTYSVTGKEARNWSNTTNWIAAISFDEKKPSELPVDSKHTKKINKVDYSNIIHTDEKRYVFDNDDQKVAENILRDGTLAQETAFRFNTFGEIDAEGTGGVWYLFRFYDGKGRIWKTNSEKEVYTISFQDLAGSDTARLQSATRDLAPITYDEKALQDLLKWDYKDLEMSEIERDKLKRAGVKTTPAYDVPNTTSGQYIPVTVLAGQTSPIIPNKTSITWLFPQQPGIQTVVFEIWPSKNPNLKTQLPVVISNGYMGVDVSALHSDIYEFNIFYYLPNISTPMYYTTGTTQFDSGHSENSFWLVATVRQDQLVYFSGKTDNLKAVILKQNEQKIVQLDVQKDSKTGQLYVDLSNFYSGMYTVQPVTADKNDFPDSLPFTIYTQKPSPTPLARELHLDNVAISYLEQKGYHGQIKWTAPENYKDNPIKLRCEYLDNTGSKRTHIDIITPSEDLGHYTDSKGNVLICNTEFEYPLKEINTISLAVGISQDQWLWLIWQLKPVLPFKFKKAKTKNDVYEMITRYKHWNESTPREYKDEKDPASRSNKIDDDTITTTNFGSRIIQYISPIDNLADLPNLQYFDTSLSSAAQWKPLPCLGLSQSGIIVDATRIPMGSYPYKINDVDAPSPFCNALGGSVYTSQAPSSIQIIVPKNFITHDRWSNVVVSTDGRGNQTTNRYNANDQLLQTTEPAVLVVNEDGSQATQSPVTTYAYSVRGFLIGTCDANNHTTGRILDEAGQITALVLSDGLVTRRSILDGLSREQQYIDNQGQVWTQTFNRKDQITQLTSPLSRNTIFGYNEKSRYLETNADGYTRRYDHDALNNICFDYLAEPALGIGTMRVMDRNRHIIRQVDQDGATQSHYRTYFGNYVKGSKGYTDITGADTTFESDFKWQVTRQTSVGGNHGSMVTVGETITTHDPFFPVINELNEFPTPGQNLEFIYKAGRLMTVIDNVKQWKTSYTYDVDGHRTSTEIWLMDKKCIFRKINTYIDALSREYLTYDNFMMAQQTFDAVSNRRSTHAEIYFYGQPLTVADSWNKYDENNFPTIIDGILAGNQIIILPLQGTIYENKNGLRSKETRITEREFKQVDTTLIYDRDGYLSETDSKELETYRTYYARGVQRQYSKVDFTKFFPLPTPQFVTDISEFNGNDWQVHDTHTESSVFEDNQSDTIYIFDGQPTYKGDGLPPIQNTTNKDGSWIKILNMYGVGFDTWRLTSMEAKAYDGHDHYSDQTTLRYLYDSNGTINSLFGSVDKDGNVPLRVLFTTYNGILLMKSNFSSSVPTGLGWPKGSDYYLLTVNDHYLASYKGTEDDSDPMILNLGYITANNGPKGGRAIASNPRGKFELSSFVKPVNDLFPINQQKRHRAIDGETFSTIGIGMRGDQQFATTIATANGYNKGDTPEAGYNLTVPPYIPMSNTAENWQPYGELVQKLIGTLSPHFVFHYDDNTDLFSVIVSALVFVAAIIIAPHLAGLLLGAAFTTGAVTAGEAVLTGVCAGALDAAGQGLMVGAGVLSKFSWGEVVSASLTAGIPLPGGAVVTQSGKVAINATKMAELMIRSGTNAAAGQLADMATGNRKSFDFASLVTSITSVLVDTPLTSRISNAAVSTAVASLSDGVMQSVITNTPFRLDIIAAQALGSYAGMQAGSTLAETIDQYQIRNYRAAQQASRGYHRNAMSSDVKDSPVVESKFTTKSNVPASTLSKKPEPTTRKAQLPGSDVKDEAKQAIDNHLPDITLDPKEMFDRFVRGDYQTSPEVKTASTVLQRTKNQARANSPVEDALNYAPSPYNGKLTNPSIPKASLWEHITSAMDYIEPALMAEPAWGGTEEVVSLGIKGIRLIGKEVSALTNRFSFFAKTIDKVTETKPLTKPSLEGWMPNKVGEIAPGLYKADPKQIKFAQSTVSPHFRNGTRVDDLVQKLKNKEILPEEIKPIQVVQKDGKLFAMDNRRLLAFNTAGIDEIPVEVVSLDDAAVSIRFENRFEPIHKSGEYIVVVNRAGRADAINQLHIRNMLEERAFEYSNR